MSSKSGRTLYKDDEMQVVQYDKYTHIEDKTAPHLSDSVLIFKSTTFWKMVRKCRGRKDSD